MTARSPQQQEVDNWPLLSQVLPIKFPNEQRVETLTMVCPDCRQEIPEKEIRASVSIFPADVASVKAWARCTSCQRKLTNNFRIRATGQSFQLEEFHDEFIRVYRVSERVNFFHSLCAAFRRLRIWARS